MSEYRHPVSLFASFSGSGGVERMLVNLMQGFIDLGRGVDLLLVRAEGPHLARLPKAVNIVRLGGDHTLLAVPALVRYLRQERPLALLAAKDRAGRAALLARRLAGTDTRILLRLGTNLSTAMAGRSALRRQLRFWPIRRLYPQIDQIVAVSCGVADDIASVARIPRESIEVIRNPVITPELRRLAAEPCAHPWFQDEGPPVILGAGRLQKQKDFPTLIRAFALVSRERPCRLVILGDGKGRDALRDLISQLGLDARVDLPGFQTNPFPFLSRADLFVLSSAWEGSPNVLTEAMALGTPVASTDCPSGPSELLDGGRIAPLVPVGDADGLAAAIKQVLDHPPPPKLLSDAVSEYSQAESAQRYLAALNLPA